MEFHFFVEGSSIRNRFRESTKIEDKGVTELVVSTDYLN